MNFFCRKIFTAFLFLSFAFNARASNDTLTIGEAFDWSAGDTIIYYGVNYAVHNNPNTHCSWPIDGEWFDTIAVVSRVDSSDQITYTLQYRWHTGIVVFDKKDSSVLSLRNYNVSDYQCLRFGDLGDIYNYIVFVETTDTVHELLWNYEIYSGTLGTMGQAKFLRKLGMLEEDLSISHGGLYGCDWWTVHCKTKLIYYKSGSFVWQDTTRQFALNVNKPPSPSPSFHLSPNPANETVTLSAETETASEPFNVLVYDITGACVRNIQPNSIRSLTIPVNDLSPGYYVIKVSNGNHYLAAKGFIIAR